MKDFVQSEAEEGDYSDIEREEREAEEIEEIIRDTDTCSSDCPSLQSINNDEPWCPLESADEEFRRRISD